jgi:hypothetical protein
VKEIYRLGLKHGMKLAAISGVNGVFTDEHIAKVVELAKAARKTWQQGGAAPKPARAPRKAAAPKAASPTPAKRGSTKAAATKRAAAGKAPAAAKAAPAARKAGRRKAPATAGA